LIKKTTRIPAHIRALWGKPPLLRHEDPQAFWQLAGSISPDVGPTSIIGWLQLKDVVDHTWEIIRLRRYNALIIEIRAEDPRFSGEESETDEEFETDAESEADEKLETDGESVPADVGGPA
jgi:hypothetical protein